MSGAFESMVEKFWGAWSRGEGYTDAYEGKITLDDAYRLQLAVVDRRVEVGERQIGWKVGLTSKPIQEQFGFFAPVFACVLNVHPSGHVLPPNLMKPGFETELCVRLTRPLAGDVTRQEALAAIETVMPAFEIVETRGPLRDLALIMADNGQQHSVVLGEPAAPRADLDEVAVRVWQNDVEVAQGVGAAVLGHPLESVVWLSRTLGAFGRSLRAGDIVMLGSFVRQFPMNPGDRAKATFSGIGSVEVRVSR